MGARAPSLEPFPGLAELPSDAALPLTGFGGPPRVHVRTWRQQLDVEVESISQLAAQHVNADQWWLVRPSAGSWPVGKLSLDLAIEGQAWVKGPDGEPVLTPTPDVTSRVVVTKRRATPPTLAFTPGPAMEVPVMTWPGNPPQRSAQVSLSSLASDAGPIVEVTLRCRSKQTTVDRTGWIEIAHPWTSWFLQDEPVPEVIGARVRDLAGNVSAYGDIDAV